MKKDAGKVINSVENERVRVTVYEDKNKPFTIRNKHYKGVGSLINGLFVIHASERFPCFDSSDFLYENRFYHWFFICASLSDYMKKKKLLKRREIPLRSFDVRTAASVWEKNYGGFELLVAYCRDDSDGLIVAESK